MSDEVRVSESSGKEYFVGPTADMAGRRVDFGRAGEGKGMAWGIELDFNISDPLVRYRIEEGGVRIPDKIKHIKYLNLAPQEALPRELRNISSKLRPKSSNIIAVATPAAPGNTVIEKLRRGLNLLMPKDESRFKMFGIMISWVVNSSRKSRDNVYRALDNSVGDTLLFVHGHSYRMTKMGEQDRQSVVDANGDVIQREGNDVSMEEILKRYNNPDKFAAIIIHGCNVAGATIEEMDVPVFYPPVAVANMPNPMVPWSKAGGLGR